jgi:hypothetical protein
MDYSSQSNLCRGNRGCSYTIRGIRASALAVQPEICKLPGVKCLIFRPQLFIVGPLSEQALHHLPYKYGASANFVLSNVGPLID